jgi:DNA-binding transcriptional MocR family regulator
MPEDSSTARIVQSLREQAERSAPGDRLPSSRELVAEHGVSPLTVREAVRRLAAEGVVETRPGHGTFVLARRTRRVADYGWQSAALGEARVDAGTLRDVAEPPAEGMLILSTGYPEPGLQATGLLGAALARAARRPEAWDRQPVAGLAGLRAWFAGQAGPDARPEDVTVTPGGQAALSAALRGLGKPGDPVLVESPTYLGATVAARAAALRPVPLPFSPRGVDPAALADAFARTGARLAYLQPTHHNPTGATLDPARRRAVLEVVQAAGAFLIEDDWARDFGIDAPSPPPIASEDPDGHVVLIRSLAKSAAPSLRIGGLVARGAARHRLRSTRMVDDLFVSGVLQQAALELVTAAGWGRHLSRLRRALAERRDALVAAVRAELGAEAVPLVPSGGLHLWVRLPEGCDDVALAARAAAEGVWVSAGRPWFPAEPSGSYLRTSFAAAPPGELRRGVERVARLVGSSEAAA